MIKERDELAANMLFLLLESARYEYVFLSDAIHTPYIRLPDKTGCPPDHWRCIFQQDKRMKTDGSDIRYAESHTLWDDLIVGIVARSNTTKVQTREKACKGCGHRSHLFSRCLQVPGIHLARHRNPGETDIGRSV